MKRTSLFSLVGVCVAFSLFLQCECLWSQEAANQVSRYIKAFQSRDFRTMVDLSYADQENVKRIKESNPQVLWSKLTEEYYSKQISLLSRPYTEPGFWVKYGMQVSGMDPNALPLQLLFPASCKWTISETRRGGSERDVVTVYVTVGYPIWRDAPLVNTKLVDQTIVNFSVSNSGLIEGFQGVPAANVYKKDPMRILNVVVDDVACSSCTALVYSVAGGIPPLTCTAQLGASKTRKDCSSELGASGYTVFQAKDFQPEYSGRGGLQAQLKVLDAAGKTDQVSFLVPRFTSGLTAVYTYCWVREPWFGRKIGRPPDNMFCADPVNQLGEATENVANAGGTPSVEKVTPAVPSAPVAATSNCTDYSSCMTIGYAALGSSQWNDALAAFQKASSLDPSKPNAWESIGSTYLVMGREQDSPPMWDRALQAGDMWFRVCRERLGGCDAGTLRFSSGEVSFVAKGQTIFAVPPSQVSFLGERTHVVGPPTPYVGLRIANKNYNFDFLPSGVQCDKLAQCPEPGLRQQLAVANYLSQTIPKLASGNFTTTANAKPSCSGATELGYSLLVVDHVYKVKGIASASGGQVHVFFDDKGSPVQDSNLLQKLALGAWTKERIVDRYSPSSGSTGAKAALYTFSSLQGWQDATDLLARATVESLAAVVTGGVSVETMQNRLVWGVVQKQFTDPKPALAHWVRAGLEQSLADYTQIESLLPKLGPTEFRLPDLEQVAPLYTKANTLASVNQALGAALAPTTWQDEFTQYLRSAVSELVPQLGLKTNALLTLPDVLKLEQYVSGTGQTFAAYKQSLELSLKVSQSNQQVISAWAADAVRGCQ